MLHNIFHMILTDTDADMIWQGCADTKIILRNRKCTWIKIRIKREG